MTRLRVVEPDATPEEIAAIVAAFGALRGGTPAAASDESLHEWVRVARLHARRSGLQRGPWRLSGRVGRRPPS
ncbi:MAG TPA: acyl-CoA carboxylase epsilon subunit [Acidimicrobiia bacterium]|jgi:hypothetical protein